MNLTIPSPETSQSSIVKRPLGRKSLAVNSVTLNDYIASNTFGHIDFAKIDIEGGEYDIICNSNALSHVSASIIEVHAELMGTRREAQLLKVLHNTGQLVHLNGELFNKKDVKDKGRYHVLWQADDVNTG